MSFEITEIVLHDDTCIVPGKITVIVGPNNCGKTRFLNELYRWLTNQLSDPKIVRDINSNMTDVDRIFEQLRIGITRQNGTNVLFTSPRGAFTAVNMSSDQSLIDTLRKQLEISSPTKTESFRSWFGLATIGLISTEDRLTASKETTSIVEDKNLLTAFYKGGRSVEKTVSNHSKQVFGLHIRLDDSKLGRLSIKVGNDFSTVPERAMDAAPIMEQFFKLEEQGDGIRSFTTILLMVLLASQPYILIDEPDAFLHPPQAADLGRILAELAIPERRLLTSTHSVDFLRGVLSKTNDVTIVRLHRNEAGTHANILAAADIEEINNSPLLNSAKVLDGLFYQGVVITEGDSDRAFYERANRRLFPTDEIHFVNAHNKQTIKKLIDPYRKAKVNFAAIVDIDIIRSSDDIHHLLRSTGVVDNEQRILELVAIIREHIGALSEVNRYNVALSSMEACLINEKEKAPFEPGSESANLEADSRLKVFSTCVGNAFDEANKWARIKRDGREALTGDALTAFNELDGLMRQTGIFMVPCGSLEGWLTQHGVPTTRNKSKWIIDALEWLSANNIAEVQALKDFLTALHNRLVS